MSLKGIDDLIDGPNQQHLEQIKVELNEDEEKFQNNLKLLREWVRCQPYLPQNFEERMLEVVLHGRENKLDEAKTKFRNYFITKSTIFGSGALRLRYLAENQKLMDNFGLFPLRKLTDNGYRVYLLFIKSPDCDLFDIDLYIKSGIPLRHIMYCNEGRIAGDYVIMDGTHFGPRHCTKALTPFLLKILTLIQRMYPVILKQIHFININPHIEKVLLVARQLLKEKIRRRIVVHRESHRELSKYFSLDILPSDYGGKEESKEELSQKWDQFMLDHKQWVMNQVNNVNCTGNIPKHDLNEALSEGSFRQLNID